MPTPLTRRRFLTGALATGGALAPGKGYFDAGSLRLNRITLPVAGLPAPFEGMRIGFAADFHHSPIGRRSLFRRAGELLREDAPDLILLGGDFVNESEAPDPVPRVRELADALGPLAAPLGLFAVTGNHDLWLGHDATTLLKDALTDRLGVTWLDNRRLPLMRGGETVTLAGVVDPYHAREDAARALAGYAEAAPVILLSHSPDVNGGLANRPEVKLVLAGHTHGGQIVPPLYGPLYVPSIYGARYLAGRVDDGERITFVTTGVGTVVLPFRWNAPPEVACITLVAKATMAP